MISKSTNRLAWAMATLWFCMAAAQLTTLQSNDPVLGGRDPLVHLTGRQVLLLTGCLELLTSGILVLVRWRIGFGLSALLSCMFGLHRVYLRSQDAPNLTDCLGNFNDWFPIAPRIFCAIWWGALVVLLVGSMAGIATEAWPSGHDDDTSLVPLGATGKGAFLRDTLPGDTRRRRTRRRGRPHAGP